MMDMVSRAFYKVVVIEVGMMESKIVDERHFSSEELAEAFGKKQKIGKNNVFYLIVKVD